MSEPTDRELADELRNWAVAMESAGWPPVQAVMRLAASRLDRSVPREEWLSDLLEQRDEFIVEVGLWGKFCNEFLKKRPNKFPNPDPMDRDASPTRADNRKE